MSTVRFRALRPVALILVALALFGLVGVAWAASTTVATLNWGANYNFSGTCIGHTDQADVLHMKLQTVSPYTVHEDVYYAVNGDYRRDTLKYVSSAGKIVYVQCWVTGWSSTDNHQF